MRGVGKQTQWPAPHDFFQQPSCKGEVRMSVIEQIFFLPPMAVARLGGSDTPLASFTWVEDPSTHGAGTTIIEPATSLEVQPDGAVRPFLPIAIQFRDGNLLRPVAPFFELWAKVQGQAEPQRLTSDLLA